MKNDSSFGSRQSHGHTVIGEKETKLVNLSKVLVAAAFCIVACLIGFVTHAFLKNQEETAYNDQVT